MVGLGLLHAASAQAGFAPSDSSVPEPACPPMSGGEQRLMKSRVASEWHYLCRNMLIVCGKIPRSSVVPSNMVKCAPRIPLNSKGYRATAPSRAVRQRRPTRRSRPPRILRAAPSARIATFIMHGRDLNRENSRLAAAHAHLVGGHGDGHE